MQGLGNRAVRDETEPSALNCKCCWAAPLGLVLKLGLGVEEGESQ